jgi:hypothetical protein
MGRYGRGEGALRQPRILLRAFGAGVRRLLSASSIYVRGSFVPVSVFSRAAEDRKKREQKKVGLHGLRRPWYISPRNRRPV